MLMKRHLADFYTVRLKKPFTDKNSYVSIAIATDDPLLLVEPTTIVLDH
jgi:hypothetical protein